MVFYLARNAQTSGYCQQKTNSVTAKASLSDAAGDRR